MSKLKIIKTEDGSHSLYNEDLNESYHSFHGAIQESKHVFIDKGLKFWRNKHGLPKHVKIFEVGFGTGLNALLTHTVAKEASLQIDYTSIESFPLDQHIIEQLNYTDNPLITSEKDIFKKMHIVNWDETEVIDENLTLTKVHQKLEDYVLESGRFDILFFDAFAPNKQEELWTIDIMQKCYEALSEGGVFVTYSAKGQLKRDLRAIGFELETLPGPPGKKEMVRALK